MRARRVSRRKKRIKTAAPRASTGGLGVGTPRPPDLHTSNLHSKDTFLLPYSS
jgi:hypothetical protein